MYQIDRVVVTIAGQQDEHIETMSRHYAAAHVQVQAGAAWVTCLDLNSVAAHAYAWAFADRDAVGHVPATLQDAQPQDLRTLASLILRHKGWASPHVDLAIDENDRNFVQVAVGSLHTRAYDLAAVTSTAQTWARALFTAQTIWAGHAPAVDPDAAERLMGRRGGLARKRPPTT